MIESIKKIVGPVHSRVMLMIGRAILKAVNDSASAQIVQASFLGEEVRDKVERMAEYGFTSVPLPGSQAVAVFVGGDRGHGIVIATGDMRYRLKGLEGGEVAIYDDQGQKVTLTRAGIVVDGGGLPVTIINTPSVTADTPEYTMTGNLTVTGNTVVGGNVVATGDVSDHGNKSMAGMRTVYNAHNHGGAGPSGGM